MENVKESAKNIYEGLMKDGDVSNYLSSFIDQAESYNSKTSDVDIVKQYLLLSGNGKEILQLVKAVSTSDTQKAFLILKALCHLLLRVANDLVAFVSLGTSIADEILSYSMKSITNFLKIKQKSSRTKLALHLLSCMIALGGQTAHKVVSKLDFANVTFTHLLRRKNFSEEEDIRTTFINLIILIMTTCDFSVIRQLVEIKGLLNDVLTGLMSDKVHVIILVLSTFRKLIVENVGISKTTKLKLFNDHSLKSVTDLYTWKGPIKYKINRKRKLGEEDQSIAYEASNEEITQVQSHAQEFMISLCCSFKTGIIFHDSSLGSSGKNQNHVLTNILVHMPKPHANKLIADFVVAVLKICPDQIIYYLPCLKSSCAPRHSSLWSDALDVVKRVIDAQDPVSCIFKQNEKMPVSTLINISKSICFPSVITPSEISSAFKGGQSFICYQLCNYLICILNKVKSVTEFVIKADVSQTPYSVADMSAFNQAFLTTIFQNFTFMEDLESFWEKQTSSNEKKNKEEKKKQGQSEEEKNTDLSFPSLFDQLSRILEVMQHFLLTFHHGYNKYEVNVPKLFQSLKNSHSSLSSEEICNLNIKIVDIIATQGEEAMMLWNKSLIDSPLMVLLDVYMTSPSENMFEDVSLILNKVLIYTKIFDFCPWETDIWLKSIKSSKAKHVPFIIEFINSAISSLLQNPNMFSDDIIETTFGKSSSQMSLDVTSILNDLLSIEKDPILIENFEESNSVSSNPKLCFSSLVPAALFTLNSIDSHKRKGCQPFVEKVLYHIMHHQQFPEALFPIVQKYKSNISSNLYHYFELLCSSRYSQKMPIKDEDISVVCQADLSEHLKTKFVTLHSFQNSPKGCHCDIHCEPQHLEYQYKEKVIWQLMSYIDWEINLFLEDKIQNTDILKYINLLDKLLNSLEETCVSNEPGRVSQSGQNSDLQHKIVEDILNRPSLLKLFLFTEKVPKSKKGAVKEFVNVATKLVLNIIERAISCEESHTYLGGFKEKVVKFNSFYFETAIMRKNTVMFENPDVCFIISIFSNMYSCGDITYMLEGLLNLESGDVKLENYFSTVIFIFKMYIELKDFMMLSPKAMNSLFIKYTESPKKQKKILTDYIMQMFGKHPILASVVNSDTCYLLLKKPACKNFYVLGCLIDCNSNLRVVIQSTITENLEELQNTPDFIYLVSKCILNSTFSEEQDKHFLEVVALLFWEKISEYILIDVASPDMLLETCGAGKAVQVLFNQKILAEKKIYRYFKTHNDALTSAVPSTSKMFILIHFMEVLRTNYLESNKCALLILKLSCHWLDCVISSWKSASEFKYFLLLHFTKSLLQSVSSINMAYLVEADAFFQKMLKVAMKYREIGSELINILTLLCQKSHNSDVPTQLLFSLVTCHSNFFNIMLSQTNENELWKESIVDLLITSVSRDKSVCQDNHLGLILSSYTGSLKSIDRKLLYLIKLYSEGDIAMAKFSPFLWSKAAVVHYSVLNVGNEHLWKKPKQQDLLSIFSLEMLETTVKNYPLFLKLEPSFENSSEELENYSNLHKIYDLRFILPLLANLLSPGSFVHCKSFMDSKVLVLIFASLSSHDSNTRALGYYCLSQLYFHLEGANYREKDIWLSLLDSLRNSITSENPRIPSIITLFLARTTFIFTKPGHSLFPALSNFIMVKPYLDISQVPEFYRLFNSLTIEHRIQRMWLLRLLSDGLRSSVDFHISEKLYIFSLILTHYWSSISSTEEKSEILRIISAAAKVDTSVHILNQNAVLPWLHNIVQTTGSSDVNIHRNLCSLLKNLWFTSKMFCCQKTSEESETNPNENQIKIKNLYISFPNEFLLVMLNFLRKSKNFDAASLKSFVLTLHDVLTFLKNCECDTKTSELSLNHISHILECWQEISMKEAKNKNSENRQNNVDSASDFKLLCEMLSKIILLWTPVWKSHNKLYYSEQQLCVLKSVELVYQLHDMSSSCISNLSIWLYRCIKEDKDHGLVKLLASSKGELYLRLILDCYEKSLIIQSQTINQSEKDCIQLYSESRKSTSHQWLKILLYFKKVCKNCNLSPELNLYHQITMIL